MKQIADHAAPRPARNALLAPPIVFAVDDDPGVCNALSLLMHSVGLESRTYASAQAFLDAYDPDQTGCLVLDLCMPEMDGLQLQEQLIQRGATLPIIFVTGHGDVPTAVKALKAGAIDFIQKPFRDQVLIDKVQSAIEQDRKAHDDRRKREELARRLASLTPRERTVMEKVVDGSTNRAIASALGISQRTVEIHRAHVMEKTHTDSVQQLVQLVIQLKGA
jgi:FixJ family two-component response regulator